MSEKFTDPFRYRPDGLVLEAARKVTSFVDRHYSECFSEGKMLGVLVVDLHNDGGTPAHDSLVHVLDDRYGFLAAFSGTADGKGTLPYFVPPIFDITEPGGYFREREAEICRINREISELENSLELSSLRDGVAKAAARGENEVAAFRKRMSESKTARERLRQTISAEDSEAMEALVRESQFEKAELKRLMKRHEESIAAARKPLDSFIASLDAMKSKRQCMSDNLQQWIFRQYTVTNALGEKSDIIEIFNRHGLVPPGGTGDCAAPKLLQYAFCKGLRPVSMGEFWYGQAQPLSVKVHGHFYPSCVHKCGPLLEFMLRGMEYGHADNCCGSPGIIYEDESIIAVEKPSGILSEPGKTGSPSLPELLAGQGHGSLLTVHRLDMDTSGLVIYAKTRHAQQVMQRQFEEGSVKKTYIARLCAPDSNSFTKSAPLMAKGRISLPLAPSYEERPRQKVDPVHGKEAVTEYEVLSTLPSGETDIVFHPVTGRTHQLRVHSAHPKGLCRPVKGDMLYGGCKDGKETRLCLHALSLTFRHPSTGDEMTLATGTVPGF